MNSPDAPGTMRCGRRSIPVFVLLALLVFAAAPRNSGASPVLTDTEPPLTARTVVNGSKFLATNTGNARFATPLGPIDCTKVVLTGKLQTNSGTEIAEEVETASFTGTGAEERCTTSFLGNVKVTPKKLPWCAKATSKMTADTWELKSGTCGGALGAMEFTLDSSTVGECTYTKTTVGGSFTTGLGGTFSVSEQEFIKSAGSGFCPGSGKLAMTLDFYTDSNGSEGPEIFSS